MRRVERGRLIIHLDRPRGWSFLFLFSGVVCLLTGWEFRLRHESASAQFMLALGGLLAVAAIALLFRARAFIIDREAGTLTVRDRKPLQPARETPYPLKGIVVEVETGAVNNKHKTAYNIWIVVHRGDRIPFLREIRGFPAQRLAEEIAQDLGCTCAHRGPTP